MLDSQLVFKITSPGGLVSRVVGTEELVSYVWQALHLRSFDILGIKGLVKRGYVVEISV